MLDELLASPLWADHWTAYWDDVWMGRDARAPDVDRGAFRAWLHDVLARNVPWNEVVTQLLTATGAQQRGRLAARRLRERGQGRRRPRASTARSTGRSSTSRTRRTWRATASRTLLGVQIQCAQCHDHKTEKWTQKDFQSFAAAFVRTRLVPIDGGKPAWATSSASRSATSTAPAPRFAKMGDLDADR